MRRTHARPNVAEYAQHSYDAANLHALAGVRACPCVRSAVDPKVLDITKLMGNL